MRLAVWAGGAHKHHHGFVAGAVATHFSLRAALCPYTHHLHHTTIIDINNNTETYNLLLLYLSQYLSDRSICEFYKLRHVKAQRVVLSE
jgi:hypothetical protein